MKLLTLIRKLWRGTDGYIVTTETIIHATLMVCALVVGITALRIAVLFFFLDAAEALASRESGFATTSAPDFITVRVFPGPPFTFPDVGPIFDAGERPVPAPATKEDGV